MLVVFWGLILGFMVSTLSDSGFIHWLDVHLYRVGMAIGELYNYRLATLP